ncbi:MAG TPA: PAS domain S-box protein [Anaerolineales bacterium]|nr:PAS domain S-box protein [Anaerolineales bacterium]HNH26095.1 PAS domain S-box protein [Anaerolineales bacterium]HNM37537.1 PAS domain S-box protein [Anaerolineales bacterium]
MSNDIIHILLVEDEDPHAELIQRAFEDQGSEFQIHRVRSLTEAREHRRLNEPKLIIADWRLPDGESLELLPNHRDPLATPIILMTSYGNERIAVEALKSGALDYVVKSPESMLDMPHLARKALDQWKSRADRIHMQEALTESEAHFRLLAENASDMITRINTNGQMFYISPACKTILGYQPEEMLGVKVFDLINPEDQPQIRELFSQKPEDSPYTITYRAKHKSGHYVWLETSARAIIDHSTDEVIEIQAASRDITERKRAEEALQLAHNQLRDAYERTIEGWVRALDLRDRETEGHTQRVTDITIRVAQQLGFSEEELSHIKRGALLHDMGKIAIPDEILQKPGPLNETEWERMRQHPMYAYEMLSPIAYLNPALDIPFYHHERWNGSGYPHGLKGEKIPLSARLFAIVDVWDALRSDRPYRKAIPREQVIEYLSENANILFDPKLVEVFLKFVKENIP